MKVGNIRLQIKYNKYLLKKDLIFIKEENKMNFLDILKKVESAILGHNRIEINSKDHWKKYRKDHWKKYQIKK